VNIERAVLWRPDTSDPKTHVFIIITQLHGIIEWVVSGAELNGNYSLEAEAYDSNDNMATSSVYGSAVTRRRGFFISGAIISQNDGVDSTLVHYDDSGAMVHRIDFNGTSQGADDLDNIITTSTSSLSHGH
jgi:hypothetical protein